MKLIMILLFCPLLAFSQGRIITAFPSLRIPASSRGLAMGDLGIASANENQQLFYNAAKSAFTQHFHQASLTYMPWLSALSNDTRFLNINYMASLSNASSIGGSLNYLNLGSVFRRDNNGATISQYNAREYNMGLSYALQLTGKASLGLALRLLGQNVYTDASKEVFSMCGDISYYQFVETGGANQKIEWGAVLSNIGPKQGLPGNDAKTFLPANLGLGVAYTSTNEDDGGQFTVALDVNKLLVPSFQDSDKGVVGGMFSSFGDGLGNELKEIRVSAGIEYGLRNEFFLRGGVSLENQLNGNRKYIGLGAGYKGFVMDQSWGIDIHYLVPFGTVAAVSPFQNAFGFSLKINIGNFQ